MFKNIKKHSKIYIFCAMIITMSLTVIMINKTNSKLYNFDYDNSLLASDLSSVGSSINYVEFQLDMASDKMDFKNINENLNKSKELYEKVYSYIPAVKQNFIINDSAVYRAPIYLNDVSRHHEQIAKLFAENKYNEAHDILKEHYIPALNLLQLSIADMSSILIENAENINYNTITLIVMFVAFAFIVALFRFIKPIEKYDCQLEYTNLNATQKHNHYTDSLEESIIKFVKTLNSILLNISQAITIQAENSSQSYDDAIKNIYYIQKMLGDICEKSNNSKEPERIIKTIEDIAFQTNIIAVNIASDNSKCIASLSNYKISKNITASINKAVKEVKNAVESVSIESNIYKSKGAVDFEVNRILGTAPNVSFVSSYQPSIQSKMLNDFKYSEYPQCSKPNIIDATTHLSVYQSTDFNTEK